MYAGVRTDKQKDRLTDGQTNRWPDQPMDISEWDGLTSDEWSRPIADHVYSG